MAVNISSKQMWNGIKFVPIKIYTIPQPKNLNNHTDWLYKQFGRSQNWASGRLWYTTFGHLVMDEQVYSWYTLKFQGQYA